MDRYSVKTEKWFDVEEKGTNRKPDVTHEHDYDWDALVNDFLDRLGDFCWIVLGKCFLYSTTDGIVAIFTKQEN